MARRYPYEFRRRVLDLVEAGRPVVEIAAQSGVSDQTIYQWRHQDQIDRSLRAGTTTVELAELAVARRWIGEFETELTVMQRPVEPDRYISWAFARRALDSGLVQSRGSIGDCHDNGQMD